MPTERLQPPDRSTPVPARVRSPHSTCTAVWPAFGSRLALLAGLLAGIVGPGAATTVDLDGTWRFAIDPGRAGEHHRWHLPGLVVRDWTEVQTPHCWTVDPRFPHVGATWYRRTFALPADAAGRHARLAFERVFRRARVWVNGSFAGEHDGGYTPFTLDATAALRPGAENTLAVEVDNAWSTTTLPGSRPGPRPQDQVYPWLEYGGILGSVRLLLDDPVHLSNLRVIADPDPAGGATVTLTAWVVNTTDRPVAARVTFALARGDHPVATARGAPEVAAALPSRSVTPVHTRVSLEAGNVRRWTTDHPQLYTAHAALVVQDRETARQSATFGIRRIEAREGRLLLNGEPIRMGGGNRHSDHPRFGSIDPAEVVEEDLARMKRANMDLMRLSHYPVAGRILEWADRHGLLIIEEGLNWQLSDEQMESPEIRRNFQAQMREMIESHWNHPSVIGWSVGNEYVSYSPAGMRWTKDMVEWTRSLDPSRLVTFASNHAFSDRFTRGDEEGSHFVDLVCVNLYEQFARRLDLVHARWPGKPILVTEYGFRADTQPDEAARGAAHRAVIAAIRERPHVVGAAVWTFNDYRSRHPPGTDPTGHRQWGVVDVERRPKPTYHLLADEYSPAVIQAASVAPGGGDVSATIVARSDFPSYVLREYVVQVEWLDSAARVAGSSTLPLPVLRPGESFPLRIARPTGAERGNAVVRIRVMRPTGFITTALDIALP